MVRDYAFQPSSNINLEKIKELCLPMIPFFSNLIQDVSNLSRNSNEECRNSNEKRPRSNIPSIVIMDNTSPFSNQIPAQIHCVRDTTSQHPFTSTPIVNSVPSQMLSRKKLIANFRSWLTESRATKSSKESTTSPRMWRNALSSSRTLEIEEANRLSGNVLIDGTTHMSYGMDLCIMRDNFHRFLTTMPPEEEFMRRVTEIYLFQVHHAIEMRYLPNQQRQPQGL